MRNRRTTQTTNTHTNNNNKINKKHKDEEEEELRREGIRGTLIITIRGRRSKTRRNHNKTNVK